MLLAVALRVYVHMLMDDASCGRRCRRYVARLNVRKIHRSADLIKGMFKMTRARVLVRTGLEKRRAWAVGVLQRNLPMLPARGIFLRAHRAAVKIQSVFRCAVLMRACSVCVRCPQPGVLTFRGAVAVAVDAAACGSVACCCW